MKFGPLQVAGRRAERLEGWVAHSGRVAIARAGRTSARIGFTYPGNGSPEIIMVFRFPRAHPGFGHRDIHQRQQPGELNRLESGPVSDLNRDLVVKSRWGAKARSSVVGPEYADERLLGGSLRRRDNPVAAEILDLIVGGRVRVARHRWRRRAAKLVSRLQHERPALAPMRAQSERNQADRVLAPMARQVTGYPIDSDVRFGNLGPIALALSEDGSSHAPAQINAVRSFVVVVDPRQVFGEPRVEGRGLRWIKRNQRVVRALADRGDERERVTRRVNSCKAVVAAVNGIDRVENRDMHDGHRAAGPARPELLAKDAGVTGRDRRMIETARVDRDLVPTMNGIASRMMVGKRRSGLIAIEKLPESVAEGLILSLDGGREGRER